MKPISVKIEAFGPYTAEQTAEAFQKYCLYSGLVSAWGDKQLLSIKSFYSIIYNHESNHTVRFYTSDESRRQDKQCFTLPTQWNEFTQYLGEYIEYHSKPKPEVGQYWFVDPSVSIIPKGIVKVDNVFPCIIDCAYADGEELSCNITWLTRPATSEETEQYHKDQLLSEAKKRYPKGTKFKSALTGRCFTSKGTFIDSICGGISSHVEEQTDAYVYQSGRWAEVIQEEEHPWLTKQEQEEPTREQHIFKEMEENKKLKRRLIKKSERIKELEEGLQDSVKTIEFLIRKASHGIAVYSTSSEKRRIEAAVNKKAEELTELLNK
jgi:hypothetical protein